MTQWAHGDDLVGGGEGPDDLAAALDADFEGFTEKPNKASGGYDLVLAVFLELTRRYPADEVAPAEVWSERLSTLGFLTSRLPLVTRLVHRDLLVADIASGFSTAGYKLAPRDADASLESPFFAVASPTGGVLVTLKAPSPGSARAWVSGLRDAIDAAGPAARKVTLEDVASAASVVCVVRADGPTKVLEISEEGVSKRTNNRTRARSRSGAGPPGGPAPRPSTPDASASGPLFASDAIVVDLASASLSLIRSGERPTPGSARGGSQDAPRPTREVARLHARDRGGKRAIRRRFNVSDARTERERHPRFACAPTLVQR